MVACYCSRECQVADWKFHKMQCKENRAFVLSKPTEEHLMCLSLDFAKHFQDHFAGDLNGFKRYKERFDKLGNFGFERGRGSQSVTVGVLEIIKGEDLVKLKALAALSKKECFDDPDLCLKVQKAIQELLESRYASDEASEEDILDASAELGNAFMWTSQYTNAWACYERAKEGYTRILGEDHVKTVEADFRVATQTISSGGTLEDKIREYRRVWEKASTLLPDEEITYLIAQELANELEKKSEFAEAKEVRRWC